MAKAFLSYSTKDAEIVHRLAIDLRDRGVNVYCADLDMATGAEILDELHEKISESDSFLLLLSEYSVASDWVEREINWALALSPTQRIQIVPVMVSPCEPPSAISHIKFTDLTGNYREGLNAIVKAVLNVTVTPFSDSGIFLARKGGSGRKAQRAGYGCVGVAGVKFHWIIDSVGDTAFAIRCTEAAHSCIELVTKELLGAPNMRALLASEDLESMNGLMTQLFGVMNLGAREACLEAERNGRRVGAKAVLALQRHQEIACANIGTCGGLASWSTPEGTAFRRIESPSLHIRELTQTEELTVLGVAPLGHLELDSIKVSPVRYSQAQKTDFVALTSFGLPVDDSAMEGIIREIEGASAAEVATVICNNNVSLYEDCLCAVVCPIL